MDDQDLLRFVDIGARGGLDRAIAAHAEQLWPILFEPNHAAAAALRESSGKYPKYSVIERALGHIDGQMEFVVTANPACSSLRMPNEDVLRHYRIADHFAIASRTSLRVSRYESLVGQALVPVPDAVKIDVQGFEYEVLLGFASVLDGVLAIKLEAQFYPVYRGQKLVGDIVALLAGYGFILRRIEADKMAQFGDDLIEVEAYFTRDRGGLARISGRQREKFDLLTTAWDLPAY